MLTSPEPPLRFDYLTFPPEAYEIKWPVPGATAVAARVTELLAAAGIASATGAREVARRANQAEAPIRWNGAHLWPLSPQQRSRSLCARLTSAVPCSQMAAEALITACLYQ